MTMFNREIYLKDPTTTKLVNEGVANVNDTATAHDQAVLRYELETFVCDGQYQKGLAHILETYLKNVDQAQQPAVWISGFYGSGKSHLVKMLRALWVDTPFSDGATARGVADLPVGINDLLKELSTRARRHGGLFAASGTLGAAASGSVRLALLHIIFKAAGLPTHYPAARFVLWLQGEGILDEVRAHVIQQGYDWQEELDNFYVAEGLHAALVQAKPNLFGTPASCVETLNNLYPYVADISNDDMVKTIRQVLTREKKFPLTLIVLDEIQQFIGGDNQRSLDVQEVVETCCKSIGGKLLFVGTGQTAVTGTANLKKLEGRFTVRIELSDADVDAVIRKVILAKQPEAVPVIEKTMETNLGEISRHLAGSAIGHRQDDVPHFSQDYPILPVRRRFWENALRFLDPTGTDSQLRNQLGMIHKVIQTNLDQPVGNVVPADYLYFDAADKLLQARILPRRLHEKTMTWLRGTEDEQLMARACGLVFLVAKLAGKNNEVGIRATVDSVADLLVTDLKAGSGDLRGRLPVLLDNCELLMKVGDEYRIQTEESAAWNDEFLAQRNKLANEAYRVEAERDDRIRSLFGDLVKKLSLVQGKSKVVRDIHPVFETQLPADADKKICLWVRNGWSTDENSVRADARQAGSQSPTVFVFVPKRSADDLRRQLIDFKAAAATLEKRGVPSSPEGTEARAAMETTRQSAEARIRELLADAFSGARVFQASGNEILGSSLQENVTEAAGNALQRLYPQFALADHPGWDKVYAKAKQGAPDALKAVSDGGEPAQNPVCKAILGFIAGGKNGTAIRQQFEAPPYGWSRDAVDGALQVLLGAGLVRATDEKSQPITPRDLERKAIGKAYFVMEATTISAAQRIQIRKLLQKAQVKVVSGQELQAVGEFIRAMSDLGQRAGGEAPRPPLPDIQHLEDLRLSVGNEQLLAVFNLRDRLGDEFENWSRVAQQIESRWPAWIQLQQLLGHAKGLQGAEVFQAQAAQIADQRMLLAGPDPVKPLVASLAQLLREALNDLDQRYASAHEQGMERLRQDANWQQLEPELRRELLAEHTLTEAAPPKDNAQTTVELHKTLAAMPLSNFSDRVAAMPARFSQVLQGAAELLEPEIHFVGIPHRILKTEAEIDDWLNEIKAMLVAALEKGPVGVK